DATVDDIDSFFHLSVAEATNNEAFIEFFIDMSFEILPHLAFSSDLNPALITPDYIRNSVTEHRAICEAISEGNADAARDAMQAHLTRSHQRYRGFNGSMGSPLSNVTER